MAGSIYRGCRLIYAEQECKLACLHQRLINKHYRKISNIRRAIVGNKIVDQSDVVVVSTVCYSCIFILDLTPGCNGFDKDNCKTIQEISNFCDLVCLILNI